MFRVLLEVSNFTLKNSKYHKFMDLVKPPLGSKIQITN